MGRPAGLLAAALLAASFGGGAATAQVNRTLGALDPGESVTVRFDVVISNALPPGVFSVSNQATVSGGNFSAIVTDDPDTGSPGDPTVTLVILPAFATSATVQTNGNLAVDFGGTPGQNYIIQSAPQLIAPVTWQNIATNTANGLGQYSITNTPATGGTNQFYRGVLP